MKTEDLDVITDEDRCIILKHLHDQYDAMCELCGKDSEEAVEAKSLYKKVLAGQLKDCWQDVECFYDETSYAIQNGMNADAELIKMVTKVLGKKVC